MRETHLRTITNPGTRSFDLPAGWSARVPGEADIPAVAKLWADGKRAVAGTAAQDLRAVTRDIIGIASWGQRQLVIIDDQGTVQAWAAVRDRTVGRCDVRINVNLELDDELENRIASGVLAWVDDVGGLLAERRRAETSQLGVDIDERDTEMAGWLRAAGYEMVRTWLQMSRPVGAHESDPTTVVPPRPGVSVRPVAMNSNGLPKAFDVQSLHQILEESFEDHFNSYRESFQDFIIRSRRDPTASWDDWWLAQVDLDGHQHLAGAVVTSEILATENAAAGTYIDYIGVHRIARGRGLAKSLLAQIIADAAQRGRDRVDLEVDADSPTGADGLYTSMGWQTRRRTQTWHRMVPALTVETATELEVTAEG